MHTHIHTHIQSQQGSVDIHQLPQNESPAIDFVSLLCAVVDYIACTVRVYVCTSNILFTGQCQS